MYLKNLELIGFKSFASKTRLQFEPGMTAIVGPNGCGKSNISDSIRWVLGEQRAKALRGSKMEDIIFNGTDSQKPLSMAEVSITLADCESTLGTDYNEVTVTRRVLRSGEGQYFINKTPCRLKDIQRLFMDTGIGTNSYSLMEQGRIDQILSSRPEDRRAVFEEASGITKFKADKKEAIRKLDQTEANLLRLADIIREVKRRIISLQRQAGKAKRYKSLQEELRAFDTYLSRDRLKQLATEITALEEKLAAIHGGEESARATIQQTEQQAHELRSRVQQKEDEIAQAMEAASRTNAERERAEQTIQVNQDRIKELKQLSERDHRDAHEAHERVNVHRTTLVEVGEQLSAAEQARMDADADAQSSAAKLQEMDAAVRQIRDLLNQLRSESVDLESRGARLQNELSDLDARERNSVTRRERLAAELAATQRAVEKFESRKSEAEAHMNSLREAVATQKEQAQTLQSEKNNLRDLMATERKRLGEWQQKVAAREAQTELYRQSEAEAEDVPPGARRILSSDEEPLIPADQVLGTLADHIQAPEEFQKALEAVLRAWLDAVIVSDPAALQNALAALESTGAGSARLLAMDAAMDATDSFHDLPGQALRDCVNVSDRATGLANRLFAGVRIVDSLTDIQSTDVSPAAVFVTRTGLVLRGGAGEIWMPSAQETNPLKRRHLLTQWLGELDELRNQMARAELALQELQERDHTVDEQRAAVQKALDEARHELSLCEGEHRVKAQEAKQAAQQMETVSFELEQLVQQQASSGERRQSIIDEIESARSRQADVRHEIASQTETLQKMEDERGQWLSEVTEKRVLLGERRQAVAQLTAQREDLQNRITELDALIQERRQGLDSYETRIEELSQHVEKTQARLQPLGDQLAQQKQALEQARQNREDHTLALRHMESQLHEHRTALEEVRNQRSKLDVELAEQRLRRQTIVDRLSQEYRLSPEELEELPEPQWENEQQPDRDTLETMIAEIRTKLDSMGPVNLIAIEEHQELEERFEFLTAQQDDLVKAKNQLLDMIRRINNTTTDMFKRTFEQVNENFQKTFKQLFGGGSARLVLVDDDDVLDSGIEIIARPPGKKLQTISLLSGGERTMTAVALLFGLYMVKPSPFCVLDELDAALDDANIGRFVGMVQEFQANSQFVVITHNRQTIEAADALYGVTMEKFGVSKIMSVRFNKHEAGDAADSTETEPQDE